MHGRGVYSTQGNHGLAHKCVEKSEEYMCDDESRLVFVNSVPVILSTMGEYDSAIDIIDTFLDEVGDNEMNPYIADFIGQKMYCYNNMGEWEKCIDSAEDIMEYFELINQFNHQLYHLALLYKVNCLTCLNNIEVATDVLTYANKIFDKYGEPVDDVKIQFEKAGADILYINGEYEKCEETYLNLIRKIEDYSKLNSFNYNRLKSSILYGLSCLYKKKEDLDSAHVCASLALDEVLKLYKSIEYNHHDVVDIISLCIDIAKLREDYMEEFSRYKLIYYIWKSDEILSEIDDCYSRASTNPKYKKTNDFKKLKKEYNKFKEEIMQ